jgi:hypothetical protein
VGGLLAGYSACFQPVFQINNLIVKLIFTAYSTVWIDKIYEANDNADNFHPAIDVLKGLL